MLNIKHLTTGHWSIDQLNAAIIDMMRNTCDYDVKLKARE